MKILLIEDDLAISKILAIAFKQNGIETRVSSDGKDGLKQAATGAYELIILDLLLPDISGEEICRAIRNTDPNIPIIAMTALGDSDIKVRMFDLGVDDYITKPFQFAELYARARSCLRKRKIYLDDTLSYSDVVLDRKKREVQRAGKKILLRDKETRMLEYMLMHREQVLTREMILNYAWGPNVERFTNVIDVHIHHLRDKLDKPFDEKLIKTVSNVGYKLSKN